MEQPNLPKGKLPPQAIELEQKVLGSLMQYKKAVFEVSNILFEEAFYKQEHKVIYGAIRTLFVENNPIDLLTVSNKLRSLKKLSSIGGDAYLIELTNRGFTSAQIEYDSRIILQKYIAREVIKMHSEGLAYAYDEDMDVFEMLDRAYDAMAKVTERTMEPSEIPFKRTAEEEIRRARDIYDKKIDPGMLCSIDAINKVTGGWRDSELIILAARPSMGKTALALNFVTASALMGNPVAFFSLEMSRSQLVKRILASISKIHNDKWTKWGISLEDEKLVREHGGAWEKISKNLHIDDTASLSIEKLKVKAKIAYKKHGIKLLVIDYLQLMSGNTRSNRNREQEISSISRGLKEIAKELNIPVIALSQLSRNVEQRGGSKRPGLSDLRESGAIEQDADIVMFLYRPEYYGIDEWDDDVRGPTSGQAEGIIKKNRNGGLGEARMKFQPEYSLFEDIETWDVPPPPPKGIAETPSYDAYLGEKQDDTPF